MAHPAAQHQGLAPRARRSAGPPGAEGGSQTAPAMGGAGAGERLGQCLPHQQHTRQGHTAASGSSRQQTQGQRTTVQHPYSAANGRQQLALGKTVPTLSCCCTASAGHQDSKSTAAYRGGAINGHSWQRVASPGAGLCPLAGGQPPHLDLGCRAASSAANEAYDIWGILSPASKCYGWAELKASVGVILCSGHLSGIFISELLLEAPSWVAV